MGELHLEIITDRLLREFSVGANVGRPQVAYKETITEPVEAEGRYIKQSGGAGDFGVVEIEVEPADPGSGFAFEAAARGGAIPKEFIPAVRQGCEEACQSGELAGYPVVDLKVRLVGGRRTKWTPRSAPSRSPDRSPCERRCARRRARSWNR